MDESAVGKIKSVFCLRSAPASKALEPSNDSCETQFAKKAPPAPDEPFHVSAHSPTGNGAITGPNRGPTGVPVIHLDLRREEISHRVSRFQLTFASFGEEKKKHALQMSTSVHENVRGQLLDAGFKISSANGGLSPAKEDVIICR